MGEVQAKVPQEKGSDIRTGIRSVSQSQDKSVLKQKPGTKSRIRTHQESGLELRAKNQNQRSNKRKLGTHRGQGLATQSLPGLEYGGLAMAFKIWSG